MNSWKALVIPDPRIEVVPESAFDSEADWAPHGALLVGYQGVRLRVAMKPRNGFEENIDLPLGLGGPDVPASLDVGFKKWRFVIGDGEDKQCVLSFDAKSEEKVD